MVPCWSSNAATHSRGIPEVVSSSDSLRDRIPAPSTYLTSPSTVTGTTTPTVGCFTVSEMNSGVMCGLPVVKGSAIADMSARRGNGVP